MAKLIKQLHDLVDLAIDKGVTNYVPRARIDDAIDQGQQKLFRRMIRDYPRDKRVRNYLLPFQKTANITVTANVGPLPADYEHDVEAYGVVSSVKYEIRIKEPGFFRQRVRDPVDPPSTTNNFGMIFNDGAGKKIELASQITPITLLYWRKPVKPEYKTTINGQGQEVYDDPTSVDVEWSHTLHDIVVQYCLLPLGIGIKDGAVVAAGREVEPKEATL